MIEASFNDYQLSGELLKAIGMLGYKNPTKVQQQVVPAVLEQKERV